MNDPAYKAIKQRHPDIPQDPLPFDVTAEAPESSDESTKKRPGPKRIRLADCPHCRSDNPVSVIRAPDGREVFRDHNRVMRSGLRLPCNGSGKAAPGANP
jgi:hypothetical protein